MKEYQFITLGHGSGGRLTDDLIKHVFLPVFSNPFLSSLGDSALFSVQSNRLAMTTDAFVIDPLFFPGGDIGRLSIFGTVNDLAVVGACPLYISTAFILEEGFSLVNLRRIVSSMGNASREANVSVITGDTKVVEKGHGDGIYITTTGIGVMREIEPPGLNSITVGDVVIVSGYIGDHGAMIAGLRSNISSNLISDCAPVTRIVDALYLSGVIPKFMRDPTRGGLCQILAEVAREINLTIELYEEHIPIRDEVRTICDILGIDPLYLACEGRVVIVVEPEKANKALEIIQSVSQGEGASIIGKVTDPRVGPVILVTKFGGRRIYDTMTGVQLPRIC